MWALAAPHREALAAAVCAAFGCRKPDGGLKTMSSQDGPPAAAEGLVALPVPLHPHRRSRRVHAPLSTVCLPVRGNRAAMANLALEPVASRAAPDCAT